MPQKRPRIGIPADVALLDDAPMHMVGEKYIAAVAHGAGGLPILLPALPAGREMASLEAVISVDDLLDGLDALFLPGSPSNIAPELYDANARAVPPFDAQRDHTTLPLLRAALARDLPVLAICRGFQELNVVCGGTLHPVVHEVPGYMDHRARPGLPRDQRYAPRHTVHLSADGLLAQLFGTTEIEVNSLHEQGINRLGHGLVVEGCTNDGLVEAVRLPGQRFVVGVQWHAEWRFAERAPARALFRAFGRAARGG